MRSARRRTMKSSLTDTALVRSMVRVNVSVHRKSAALVKRFPAFLAMELSCVGVRTKVVFVGFPELERLTALFAIEWSIVDVFVAFMIVHHGFVYERCFALIARVRFVVQMSTGVHLVLGITQKASIAGLKRTAVRPFTGVNTHVRFEIGLGR